MKFLTGDTRDPLLVQWLQKFGFGRIWIDRRPTPYPSEPWGFDNGAYRNWKRGNTFDNDIYRLHLDKAYKIGCPYLAVVPDIVAQGTKSLEFSLSWMASLPSDWPWYLAVQDGMLLGEIEAEIDRFAGIFLGGSNQFKQTAWHWSQLAHGHGKLFHYARCGTIKKICHALRVNADSCDSAFPLWKRERLRLVEWALQRENHCQLSFWGPEVEAVSPWRFK